MKLVSKEDRSINFVEEQLTGFLESRYVRKTPEYFICYLSSQSGCAKGCRFCHLTATKQTKFDSARPIDYLSQASKVLKHYLQDGEAAKYVHYNFMARGEALANEHLLDNADSVLYDLGKLATSFDPNLSVRFNISTIMPKGFNRALQDTFKIIHPTIYYSFYSTNPDFRAKWMPQAMPFDQALDKLKDYQEFSKKSVKIHHCFIKDQNDSEQDVRNMAMYITDWGLKVEFNLVRYNPYSPIQGEESSPEVIERNLKILQDQLQGPVKVIPRIGRDIFASCGTFPDADYVKTFRNF